MEDRRQEFRASLAPSPWVAYTVRGWPEPPVLSGWSGTGRDEEQRVTQLKVDLRDARLRKLVRLATSWPLGEGHAERAWDTLEHAVGGWSLELLHIHTSLDHDHGEQLQEVVDTIQREVIAAPRASVGLPVGDQVVPATLLRDPRGSGAWMALAVLDDHSVRIESRVVEPEAITLDRVYDLEPLMDRRLW